MIPCWVKSHRPGQDSVAKARTGCTVVDITLSVTLAEQSMLSGGMALKPIRFELEAVPVTVLLRYHSWRIWSRFRLDQLADTCQGVIIIYITKRCDSDRGYGRGKMRW